MSRCRAPATAGTHPSTAFSPDHHLDPLAGECRVVLTLAEFCELMGLDRSTVLRKERQGLTPPRRLVAGMNVFLTAEVRDWLVHAEVSKGVPSSGRLRPRRSSATARERPDVTEEGDRPARGHQDEACT